MLARGCDPGRGVETEKSLESKQGVSLERERSDGNVPCASFPFTPAQIDLARCLGRTWNDGSGGQCPRVPLGDKAVEGQQRDLCKRCQTNKHGRVDGPVPECKLREFEKHAAKEKHKTATASASAACAADKPAGTGGGVGCGSARDGADGSGVASVRSDVFSGCLPDVTQTGFDGEQQSAPARHAGDAGIGDGGAAAEDVVIVSERGIPAPLLNVSDLLGYKGGVAADSSDNKQAALKNAGNTCYLNALLHVFARVPALRHWCQQHLVRCHSRHAGLNCHLCAVAQDLGRLCVDVSRRGFVPEIVRLRAEWSNRLFANSGQQDVTEAIALLLMGLNAVDESEALVVQPELSQLFAGGHRCRYTTPMWEALGITFKNRMSCNTCGMVSEKTEDLSALFLDVPDTATTLQALVAQYWGDQPLKEGSDEMYRCPRESPCSATAVVTKFIEATAWPPVLILGLKRFRAANERGRFVRRKTSTSVRFPRNFEPVPGAPSYSLRGVIEHRGSEANGGHYVAYVRHQDDVWSFCDDNCVPAPRSLETVLAAQAYVLVYETLGASHAAKGQGQMASASVPKESVASSSGVPSRVGNVHAHATVSDGGAVLPEATREPVTRVRQQYSTTRSVVDTEVHSAPMRRGVVSGFGSERTEDALGDAARRDDEACARQRERCNEGVRGRARDWNDNDLDRSFGGPRSFGRR